MKSRTEKILMVFRVLAWLGIFGYAFNLGSQLICFGVSFKNPVASKEIPGVAQSLLSLLNFNFSYYVFAMSFVIVLSAVFLLLWYQVMLLLSKLNLKNPFTRIVSGKVERIAYLLFAIWVIAFVGKAYLGWLSKSTGEQLNIIPVSDEFLFTAGIVYIVSQIFKHGIEIQEENQQTI